MAIYDLKEPSDPRLLDFCTRDKDDDRFKRIDADEHGVYCEINLNPSYEATFGMTPDHARDVAVRLIDAAEKAEFEIAQSKKKAAERQAELVQRKNELRELRKLRRKQ